MALYCGPCLLTDDSQLVDGLREFTESFLLELPKAGTVRLGSDSDVFLVTGPRRKFSAAMGIKKTENRKVNIKADQD